MKCQAEIAVQRKPRRAVPLFANSFCLVGERRQVKGDRTAGLCAFLEVVVIYFIQDSGNFHIKIGYTRDDPDQRIKNLQVASSAGLILLAVACGEHDEEVRLHKKFEQFRVRGEWFLPAPEIFKFILGIAMFQGEMKGRSEWAKEQESYLEFTGQAFASY